MRLCASLTAENATLLRMSLASWGAKAPHRLERRGRQKELDRWVLNRLLYVRLALGEVEFPLRIYDSEGPDFEIHEGTRFFGLEVTEAADPEEQAYRTKIAKEDHPSVLSIPRRWTTGQRSRRLVHEAIERKASKHYAVGASFLIYLNTYDDFFLSGREVLDLCVPLKDYAEIFSEVFVISDKKVVALRRAEVIADIDE